MGADDDWPGLDDARDDDRCERDERDDDCEGDHADAAEDTCHGFSKLGGGINLLD